MLRTLLAIALLASFPGQRAVLAAGKDTDADGLPDTDEQRLGTLPDSAEKLVPIATSKNENYTDQEALVNAPDILALSGCHVGGNRLLFRIDFARPPDFGGATFIVYLDLDNDPGTGRQEAGNRGVDVMVVVANDSVSLSLRNPAFTTRNTSARGVREGPSLYLALDAPLPAEGGTIPIRVHLLSERGAGRADSTADQVVPLPRSAGQVPPMPAGRDTSIRTRDDYRYHDDLVKYEKLEDKGLRAEQVTPAQPLKPGRPCPEPTFTTGPRQPGKAGSLTLQQVKVSLLEESGVPRSASAISFGFPCPEGGLYDLAEMRVLSAQGQEIPAQFTATAFWPDGSLKWVLVDFLTDLQPGEDRACAVELGSKVKRAASASSLSVKDEPTQITIVTGPLRAVIDKQRFNLLREVSFNADGAGRFGEGEQVLQGGAGMQLLDEQGKAFTSAGLPPDRVKIEQIGPRKVVVRVEGRYGAADGQAYLRYIARLTFHAGSPRVSVAWTHLDDYLKTEFTDFTSLSLPLQPTGGLKSTAVYLPEAGGKLKAQEGNSFSLLQLDERQRVPETGAELTTSERAPGLVRGIGANGTVTAVLHDFWQRWPKGLASDGKEISLQLLPPQPGPSYGTGMPHYLLFPLVSGKYRLKWGMAFTERFALDFDPQVSPDELRAEADRPVVPVLPAEWYAKTQALGPVAVPHGKQFAVWDKWVADSFQGYLALKDRTREYGFLNYGDWYGERGRNWGNNEYDLAHGLFEQFLRTGNRAYFRWALTAARHQADVDIIHAYPDAFYVGGMVPHSVGHTGAWSETLEHGTWEARYDGMVTAANGHNWADGLVDAWCLTGEPEVMESAVLLGEHVTWAMSPTFKALGTHERSAGWSLRSILAVYRQTYDPAYLAAAKRIVAVALQERKPDQGGAWPHELPLDHANGKPGIMGNNLFLIGVLLGGLQGHHEVTQDPATAEALTSSVRWVAKSWDEKAGGWPYSATPEGQPLYAPSTGLNMLVNQPVAYVAKLTNDEALWEIAEESLTAVAIGGAQSFGKSLGQELHFTGGLLALLQEHYAATRPDKGAGVLTGSPEWYAQMMVRAPDAAKHAVRAPDEKLFTVQLTAPEATLDLVRTPHGAMTKRSPMGTLKALNAAGVTVGESAFSTDDPHECRCALRGQAGEQFKVVVNDDQRGVWTLTGGNLRIVMQTAPGFSIGGVGKGKYHFLVPAGTREFRLKLVGVHTGAYGAVVLSPSGKVAGMHQDANLGPALIPGAPAGPPAPPSHPERGEIVIKPDTADTGKLWSVVLWAAGDIGVELVGVPPFLSLTEASWFEPK